MAEGLDRRAFLATSAVTVGAAAAGPPRPAIASRRRPPIGSGGVRDGTLRRIWNVQPRPRGRARGARTTAG